MYEQKTNEAMEGDHFFPSQNVFCGYIIVRMSFHIWNSFISFNYPWPMLYLTVCTLYQAYYYLYQPVRICAVPVLYFS